MTYLELCKRLRQEAGISGTGPASVSDQVGELQRVVDWVSSAWDEIQTLRTDWSFLHQSLTLNVSVGVREFSKSDVAGALSVSKWPRDLLVIKDPAVGVTDESRLLMIDYADWRQKYAIGSHDANRPIEYALSPSGSLVIGPTPDKAYTVTFEAKVEPTSLSADGDTPSMPSQYHMGIVWYALIHYGGFEEAGEVFRRGYRNWRRFETAMLNDLTPDVFIDGSSLA